MKTALITGVTGFIGRYVARIFSEQGWHIAGLGTSFAENSPTGALNQYYKLLLPSQDLAELVKTIRPDICIHCAGRASVPLSVSQPSEDFNASVASTFNLLETLRLYAPQCKLIYLSSAAVYGNPKKLPIHEMDDLAPISPYGFHKSICENLCEEYVKVYSLQIAIARIFSAYGPGLRRQVVWDITYKALNQKELFLQGTGQESRDFIHVGDVARAIYCIAQKSTFEAEIFNLASGIETTIENLAELIISKLEKDIAINFDSNVPIGNPLNWRADISSLEKYGYRSEISLDQGISIYAKWCQAEIIGW
jgi:UDP-glucose 4-epimerase